MAATAISRCPSPAGALPVMASPGPWPQLDRPPLPLLGMVTARFGRGCASAWPCRAWRTRRPPPCMGPLDGGGAGRAALAKAGWPVVSGLAEGITMRPVHRGCLEAGGRACFAVLGTTLERVYPRHTRHLQAAVPTNGLLISELAPAGRQRYARPFSPRATVCRCRSSQAVIVVWSAPSKAVRSTPAQLWAWSRGCPSGWSPPMLARPQPPVSKMRFGCCGWGGQPLTCCR